MSGRHAGTRTAVRRRFPVLLSVATALGVWLGVGAPDVSPVAPPGAAAPAAADVADTSTAPTTAAPTTVAPTTAVPTQPDPAPVDPRAGGPVRNRAGGR